MTALKNIQSPGKSDLSTELCMILLDIFTNYKTIWQQFLKIQGNNEKNYYFENYLFL